MAQQANTPQELVNTLLDSIPDQKYFLIFMSSIERGRPWCRDCQSSEPILAENIPQGQGTVIYVGSRDQWNEESNVWRQSPFSIERVPTLLKLEPARAAPQEAGDHTIVSGRIELAARMVEAELLDEDRLKRFVKS